MNITRVTSLSAAALGAVAVTHTIHTVRDGGRWTWFVAPQRWGSYMDGGCPGFVPSGPAI